MKSFLCALACSLPLATHAEPVQINSAIGQVQVEAAPATVVVLDFAALDTLGALGIGVAGRPDFTPPAYLSDYLADVPTVGTLFEPDFEALAVMAPDLIIAGGRSQTQIPALEKFAPTIDMTIDGNDMVAEAEARIDAYGAIFARADQAEKLDAELDQAIADTRAAVAGKGNAMILLTNGGKISAYGANSRFGWVHSALDLPEAYEGLTPETHGEAVSFEFVAEANPDWLLVIDRGAAVGQDGEAAAATLDNPLIARTTAAQKGQIVYLDAAALYLAGGGVQSMMLTLSELRQAFADTNG
ncbi:MAG: siderophore ABC transporter substrate-binding protein [Paracoccus sp. (in: a-proteobacteria)]